MNVADISEYVRTGGITGLLLLAAKLFVDNRRLKIDAGSAVASARKDEREAELNREKYRDSLTFQLLEAARKEVQELRHEVERLRPVDNHLQLFETALEHIEALLGANDDSRSGVERSARAFLKRMRRLQSARGTITNEVQRLESGMHVAERAVKGDTSDD